MVSNETEIVLGETENVNSQSIDLISHAHDVNVIESHDKWVEVLEMNGLLIPVVLDTIAEANLISYSDYKSLEKSPKVVKKNVKLTAYNASTIESKGCCRIDVTLRGQKFSLLFVIVKEGKTIISGRKDCERLSLVQRVSIRQVTECDLKFSDDANLGTLPMFMTSSYKKMLQQLYIRPEGFLRL